MELTKRWMPGLAAAALAALAALVLALAVAPETALADTEPTYTIVVKDKERGTILFEEEDASLNRPYTFPVDSSILPGITCLYHVQEVTGIVSEAFILQSGSGITFYVNGVGAGSISGDYLVDFEERHYEFIVTCTQNTIPVSSVTFESAPSGVAVGDAASLSAAVEPDGATDRTVIWGVGGTEGAVALYADADCKTAVTLGEATPTLAVYVKGVKAGSATVTCTSNADAGKVATCALTVSVATHKVTVAASPAEGGTAKADPAEAAAGATVTLTATPEDGYEFAGWKASTAGVQVADASKAETTFEMVGSDVAVTAAFKKKETPAKTSTLSFDLAGGTLDGKTGTYTMTANVGDTVKLPTAPTREGYTFKCWKGSEYAAGAEYKVDGDHAFTAQWTEDKPAPVTTTYTVKFDANGGKGSMDDLVGDEGSTVTLTANAFERDGYTFAGWNTAKDGSGTSYKDKAEVKLEGDMTLYAQWAKKAAAKSSPKAGDAVVPVAVVAVIAIVAAGAILVARRRMN